MSAAIHILPRITQPIAYVVPSPGVGWTVMVGGKAKPGGWFSHESAALAEAKFINDLVRATILDCATKVVQVAADFAAEHSLTLPHDAVAVCEDLGEAMRIRLMGGPTE